MLVGVSSLTGCDQAPSISLVSGSEMLGIPFFEDKIPRVEAGDGSGLHNIEGVVFMEDLPVAVHHHGYGLRDHRGVANSLS